MHTSCDLLKKRTARGNLVSKSNRKTIRTFGINTHNSKIYSAALKTYIPLRLATSTRRTIDKQGGLDEFLLSRRSVALTDYAKKLRRAITKKMRAGAEDMATEASNIDTEQ